MPPVVYGAGYGKPSTEEVHVTSTVLITDVQCRRCGKWIEVWLPENEVTKDADGYSVPPEHPCEAL